MTTYFEQSITCGACRKTSEQTVLGSTNRFGAPDLDLRPPEMMRSTMDAWLQHCPHCGYCAGDLERAPADRDALASDLYRAALERTDLPEAARKFLAYAVSTASCDPLDSAQSRLRAAWVCDDSRLATAAKEIRLQTAERFRTAIGLAGPEGRLGLSCMLVDVLRRARRFDDAAAQCKLLLADPAVDGMLRTVVEFQQTLLPRGDDAAYTLADCDPAKKK